MECVGYTIKCWRCKREAYRKAEKERPKHNIDHSKPTEAQELRRRLVCSECGARGKDITVWPKWEYGEGMGTGFPTNGWRRPATGKKS